MKKVLILEDEMNIRSFVVINLQRAGLRCRSRPERGQRRWSSCGRTRISAWRSWISCCRISTASRCAAVSGRANKQIGIIMLTARTQEMDKVTGLMTGADDYVTKPLLPGGADGPYRRACTADRRRRAGAASPEFLTYGPFRLNTRNRTLEKDGCAASRLTQVEYGIMKLFMQNPGTRPLPGGNPGHAVWGRDYNGELKIVDVNIRRLRIKIEDDTVQPRLYHDGCGATAINGVLEADAPRFTTQQPSVMKRKKLGGIQRRWLVNYRQLGRAAGRRPACLRGRLAIAMVLLLQYALQHGGRTGSRANTVADFFQHEATAI